MEKNIGTVDQYLRLVSGVIALVGAGQCRRGFSQAALTAYGAMKVAEGITGWCPLMYALGIRTVEPEHAHAPDRGSDPERAPSSAHPAKEFANEVKSTDAHGDNKRDREESSHSAVGGSDLQEADSVGGTYQ